MIVKPGLIEARLFLWDFLSFGPRMDSRGWIGYAEPGLAPRAAR